MNPESPKRKNRNEYFRKYRKENRFEVTRKKREWFQRNPEKRRHSYDTHNIRRKKRYHSDVSFRDYLDKRNLRNRRKARSDIISFLGGKCKRCGFSDSRALCIDHIKGGGNKERKEQSNGKKAVLERIKRYPKRYQLLCSNCNSIKRHENREFAFRDKRRKEIGQCTRSQRSSR